MTKRFVQIAFIFLLVFATGCGTNRSHRFDTLGHHLMCSCGCNQILLECNHVGCPLSDGMRNELTAGVAANATDEPVIQMFVQKYGPVVLAAPTMTGFDRVAWITPFLAFFLGILLVMFIVRNWRHKPLPVALPRDAEDAAMQEFRRRAHEETQL